MPLTEPRVLDVGCGLRKTPDAIGIDREAESDADVVADLEGHWPFRDNSFDVVVCNHVLEHLDNLRGALDQIHRVCRSGGVVRIVVPHFSSAGAFADPTHRRFFSYRTIKYFTGELAGLAHYSTRQFAVRRCRVRVTGWARACGGGLWAAWAPRFWEDNLCFLLRGKNLVMELEVLKPECSQGAPGERRRGRGSREPIPIAVKAIGESSDGQDEPNPD